MHTNVQTRFNPAIGDMASYYCIKESYQRTSWRTCSYWIGNSWRMVEPSGERRWNR